MARQRISKAASAAEVTSSERLDLGGPPSVRGSAAEFLKSFDVNTAPTGAGCYLMYDETGRPIYVGKAKNLRARLRTYITERDSRYSVKFLMKRVAESSFSSHQTKKRRSSSRTASSSSTSPATTSASRTTRRI